MIGAIDEAKQTATPGKPAASAESATKPVATTDPNQEPEVEHADSTHES
jgi:hypothetical protein